MPDHLHAVLQQSHEGMTISAAMADFKRLTSHRIVVSQYPAETLWRDSYDDVPLPGLKAVKHRLAYMMGNPVRAGLTSDGAGYIWSSFGTNGIVVVSDL
jgi:hypothetical protein